MKPDDVRRAFRRAEGDASPEVDPLVDAIPSLTAEANRRRQSPPAPASWWAAVPRLAVLTGVAVVLACALMVTTKGAANPSAFERVMLGTGGSGGTGDLLLDAVLDAGRDDG